MYTSPDRTARRTGGQEERGRGVARIALAGGALGGWEVAQRHGERVTNHLTGDLDAAPTWPESNRSGQALPMPVVLERQRRRRAYREWQERRGEPLPETPRPETGRPETPRPETGRSREGDER
ncbi:MAG: hypothetical protein ACRDV9_05330 [Acidimicrobiia bacterium]